MSLLDFEVVRLKTPLLPRLVPALTLDAFGWCESDWLDWRRDESFEVTSASTGENPAGMAFVFLRECPYLPRELARLHVGALARPSEWALAPYGIDTATDELYRYLERPRDVLCLAAKNLDALVWGLHDWCHFHNHGPFESPAWTEAQCDASALVWLWLNRALLNVGEPVWNERCRQFLEVARERFVREGLTLDESLYDPERLRSLSRTLEQPPLF